MEVTDGVIVIGKSEEDLRERTKEALQFVGIWMAANGLSFAPDKSEVMIGSRTIETREAVRSFGVKFQRNFRVAEQVELMVRKTKMVVGALGRLLPNVGGPRASKR
ncbi:hypothetical protein Zmor_026178 [Zophobas morio]|uniref:Reverse transcriptase domain-containing protein n=1 Tax=Zophobas morio TaxID=2755281 RepID=A0AA38HT16_9CUCU|nr:hypothetical protein Zmor_026178 [Zophobas morio]